MLMWHNNAIFKLKYRSLRPKTSGWLSKVYLNIFVIRFISGICEVRRYVWPSVMVTKKPSRKEKNFSKSGKIAKEKTGQKLLQNLEQISA